MIGGLEGLLCDLDGVIYRGARPIDGAIEAIEELRARGVRVLFATNNSRSTVDQYMEKLSGLGLGVTPEDIITSAVVAGEELARRGLAGSRALVVGGDGVRESLTRAGITVDPGDDGAVDLVVVGFDPTFDYAAMRHAAAAVRGGALLIATNDDAAFPAPDGLWPGAGAILASIEVASGKRAEVMGKPHPPMMETARRRFGPARRIAVIGDRPETDLRGGVAMGWTTILVLSGVTGADDLERLEHPPDLVLGSIAELPGVLASQ